MIRFCEVTENGAHIASYGVTVFGDEPFGAYECEDGAMADAAYHFVDKRFESERNRAIARLFCKGA